MFQGCFKEVLRVSENMFRGCFKGVSMQFKRCFKDVLRVKCVSRKFQRKVLRIFKESFNEVLFYNFAVLWISSQLPEQKEGLFCTE